MSYVDDLRDKCIEFCKANSQLELAERSGISKHEMNHFLSGRRDLSHEKHIVIAKAIGFRVMLVPEAKAMQMLVSSTLKAMKK